MADPPKKESIDDFLARELGTTAGEVRGQGGQPSARQLGKEAAPDIDVPGVGKVPAPNLALETEAAKIKDPAYKAALEAASLEAAAMVAPPMAGAALGRLLPNLMRGRTPLAVPGRAETLTSMGRAGAAGGAAEAVNEQGRGTAIEPVTSGLSNLLALLGPVGMRALAKSAAPGVTPETRGTAREAERAGMSLTPRQVSEGAPKGYGVYDQKNNIVANRMLTGAADGTPVARVTPAWLTATDTRLDQAYEYLFSPQNIFTSPTGTQGLLVSQVMSGQGMNSAVDKFLAEASQKVPFLTQHPFNPMPGGGYVSNPNFLPPDGPQLREARDMVRRLQKSPDPATRHYANEVWEATMNHIRAADPHVARELLATNARYRAYSLLEEMDKQGKIVQGNVDLQWLDDTMRKGWGGQRYRHGQDQSVPAQAGHFGRDLRIKNQPEPTNMNPLGEALIMGTGMTAAGAIPHFMGHDTFSYPTALAGLTGALTASYPARKAISGGIKKIASPVGRAIQKIPRPQQDDLATRSKIVNRLAGSRESLSAILANLHNQPQEE